MNKKQKPRILYVLGLAYSGTTLFGLSIGRHSKILNLGEVVNLENDYLPNKHCTCGDKLSECSFWAKVSKALSERQQDLPAKLRWQMAKEGKRSFLEEKSDSSRLKILFGATPETVYGESSVDAYLKKSEAFFSVVSDANKDIELIVDLSKTHERLEILSKSDDLDIWVLYLKREPLTVFHSNMKRRKRTRSKWGPKVLRESILQRLRSNEFEKTVTGIDPKKSMVASFEEFTTHPGKVIDTICNKIGISCEPIDYAGPFNLKESGQHIYVGNRWLFKDDLDDIQIKSSMKPPKLSFLQMLIFKIVLGSQKTTQNINRKL